MLLCKFLSQITKLQYFFWTKILKNSPLCTSLLPCLLQLQNQVQKCQKKCHKCKYCESIITTWRESSCSEKKYNQWYKNLLKPWTNKKGLNNVGMLRKYSFWKVSSRLLCFSLWPSKKVADERTSVGREQFWKKTTY